MPRADETVLLGLLQGPAELLPVSSSAHVGLLPWALGWEHASLSAAERKEVEVALHFGTAVVLALEHRSLRWGFLAAATLPPALAGLAFERLIEERFGTPRTVAFGLVAGAVAMVLADRTPATRTTSSVADGWVLGMAQAVALIPGVSRSGATRAAARALGFSRADAAELSREVALPVLAGATVLKGARLVARRPARATVVSLGAGAAAAALSTFAVLRYEPRAPLSAFAAYRVALAGAILAVSSRRRTAAGWGSGEAGGAGCPTYVCPDNGGRPTFCTVWVLKVGRAVRARLPYPAAVRTRDETVRDGRGDRPIWHDRKR